MKKNKVIIIGICIAILGIICFIIRSFIPTTIAEDGTLQEPFFLVGIGYILIFAGLITTIVGIIISLAKNKDEKGKNGMIIEYESKYDEQIKDLLVELQNYLIDIDDWHTQILKPEYRANYFKMDLEIVKKQQGKILLEINSDNIVEGLIIGVVSSKDEIDKLTNDCAKTGEILELIVKQNTRDNGIGRKLLETIENYFKEIDCKRINIEVFGPNKNGLNFYEKNNYIIRDYIVSKRIE